MIRKFRLMRNCFLVLLVSVFFCCSEQKEMHFVLDKSDVLDSIQELKLNTLYKEHEKHTTNQIVLLTVDDISPDSSINAYSFRTFNEMGIGRKDKNNGVLILFCNPLKVIRITTGLGTRKVLADSTVKRIIDSKMLPQFEQNKYFEGLLDGSEAIINFLERPENKID